MRESRPEDATPLGDSLAAVSSGAGLVTLFLIFLIAVVGTMAVLSVQAAEPVILSVMGILATLGALFVFGLAAGHVRISERTAAMDVGAVVADNLEAGCLLTTPEARILHANAQAAALIGTNDLGELRSLDDVFAETQQGAEILFRLSRAARQGRRHCEDIHLKPVTNIAGQEGAGPKCQRVTVAPIEFVDLAHHTGRATVWTFIDLTQERERAVV
ncbi:MAG: hypothetical protein ACR2PG_01155, partial [Hyphomicrobiaceae bacterium]